jgi:hypothetical protein
LVPLDREFQTPTRVEIRASLARSHAANPSGGVTVAVTRGESVDTTGRHADPQTTFRQPLRYSEDIDLVQLRAEPIGPTVNALRDVLSWQFCRSSLKELLGAKLRALLQRRKGRDLFDFHVGFEQLALDSARVVAALDDNEGNNDPGLLLHAGVENGGIAIAPVTPLNELRGIVGPPQEDAPGERRIVCESFHGVGDLVGRQQS